LQQLVRGFFMVFANSSVQTYASSELRASTLSLIVLAKKLTFGLNLILFAQITEVVSLQNALYIMAIMLLFLSGLFFVLSRDRFRTILKESCKKFNIKNRRKNGKRRKT